MDQNWYMLTIYDYMVIHAQEKCETKKDLWDNLIHIKFFQVFIFIVSKIVRNLNLM